MLLNIGLYIKRDGVQHIELADALPGSISTLTPMPEHSDYLSGQQTDSTSAIEYDVPVRDLATDVEEAPALNIYYRNTSKKLQANWIGKSAGRIDGAPKLADQKLIEGVLTNGTGVELDDVYLAFSYPGQDKATDWLFWMKKWDAGVSIDLSREFYLNDKNERPAPPPNRANGVRPNSGSTERIKATMRFWQDELWTPMLRGKATISGEDHIDDVAQTYVLASFFDRLVPMDNDQPDAQTRVDVLRRARAAPGSLGGALEARCRHYRPGAGQCADARASESGRRQDHRRRAGLLPVCVADRSNRRGESRNTADHES